MAGLAGTQAASLWQVNTLSYEENVAYRTFVQTHLSQVCYC